MTGAQAARAALALAVIGCTTAAVAIGRAELAGLAVGAALVFAVSERAPVSSLAVLAACAWIAAAGPDLERFVTTPWVRTWNLFHYGIGAVYFDELGYGDLYVAALTADREADGAEQWTDVRSVRDLATYEVVGRGRLPRYAHDQAFTPERWAAFERDVRALQPLVDGATWRDMFRDRGYNPSPLHARVTGLLPRVMPLDAPLGRKALGCLDWIGYAAAFGALGAAFGPRRAALAAASFALTVVNRDRLVGGFLQYDWFVAVAVGLAAVKRRAPGVAGVALAWAAVTRVFPLALVVAVVAPGLARAARARRAPDRFTRRFALAFAVAAGVGLAVGATTARGPGAWLEFEARILRHADQHATGEQRVGLAHALTVSWPLAADADAREAIVADRASPTRIVAVVGLVGLGLALVRRRPPEALVLGLVAVFLGAVASRYYYALLVLLPAVSGRRAWLDVAQVTLVLAGAGLAWAQLGPYPTYLAYEWLVAALLVAWVGERLVHDGRVARRALRAARRRTAITPPTA